MLQFFCNKLALVTAFWAVATFQLLGWIACRLRDGAALGGNFYCLQSKMLIAVAPDSRFLMG